MITLKEKKMLLKMKSAMGEDVAELRAEIDAEEAKLVTESESRRNAFENIFTGLAKNLNELAIQDKKRSTEQQTLVEQLGDLFNKISTDPQVPQQLKEDLIKADEHVEPIVQPKETVIDKVVQHVKETTAPSMFVQPNPPTVDRDIKAIQTKLKLLEGWVSKISASGPGGGAGSIDQLDHKTQVVVSDSYNVGRHDYYIGVDYPGNVAIYLPTGVTNGRVLVIKDESGAATHHPITVVGSVDNDPDGFIIKVNNGAVQLIYRNGWRII